MYSFVRLGIRRFGCSLGEFFMVWLILSILLGNFWRSSLRGVMRERGNEVRGKVGGTVKNFDYCRVSFFFYRLGYFSKFSGFYEIFFYVK